METKRISFSYKHQKLSETSKKKKKEDSLDIVHNEIQYRITGCTEHDIEYR